MPTISNAKAKKLGIKVPSKTPKTRIPVPLLGLPVKQITVQLPWPPSNNNYYRNFRGKTTISKWGRSYREAVISICRKKVNAHTVGRLVTQVWVVPNDDRDRDLDNLFKAILDSLQKAGVMINDAHIDLLTIKRCKKEAKARVVVRITGEEPNDLFKAQK